MNDALQKALKKLRLSGLAQTLDVRLQEAAGNGLSHAEFLELIRRSSCRARGSPAGRRVRALTSASQDPENFTSFKPLDQEEADLHPGHVRFIRERRDCCCSAPGTHSHLVSNRVSGLKAGHSVCTGRSSMSCATSCTMSPGRRGKVLAKYLKPDLLIVDDMGMKQLPKRSGEYLFEIIMRRYENRSTMMTSNRPLEDWGKLIGDVPSATAILDRFLHHAEVVTITGKSYGSRTGPRARMKIPMMGLAKRCPHEV
jgi:hypothetical protein